MEKEELADKILELIKDHQLHGSVPLATQFAISERQVLEAMDMIVAKGFGRKDKIGGDSAFHISKKKQLDPEMDAFIESGGFLHLKEISLQESRQKKEDQQRSAKLKQFELEKIKKDLKEMKWTRWPAWIALVLSVILSLLAIAERFSFFCKNT